MRALAFALVAVLTFAAAAGAAEEEFTPEFGALEGAELSHFLTRNFDAYKLPVGQFTRDEQPVNVIEGRIREFVYRAEDETSTLEAVRNYQRRFTELGYRTLFECAGDECGGFDFRFNAYLVEPPAMRFDLADFRYLAVEDEARERHASVIASRQGGRLFVQIIAVEGETAPERMTAAGEAPPPRVKPGQARLFALARRLTEQGHAPLDGVAFEAGSAKLTDDSAPVLTQAAELLRARPDLRFFVVGHTDNQGGFDGNLSLSRARAETVATRLAAEEGVQPGQLVPKGVGYLAPRASNATPEGRAENRRVELVLE
ncbi:OmpA family protein [Pikeienuella piscinae]|uniref:OmpA family protein n=1 Tax=Pikeienuella piscinae TaxID=2748098 RepID=A0A7M3T571_9RHOB|nr:OmpA family protein [Pikeienuella piscinae]QIE57152.1 OmpA family protein [Pikeienuella piscinae]